MSAKRETVIRYEKFSLFSLCLFFAIFIQGPLLQMRPKLKKLLNWRKHRLFYICLLHEKEEEEESNCHVLELGLTLWKSTSESKASLTPKLQPSHNERKPQNGSASNWSCKVERLFWGPQSYPCLGPRITTQILPASNKMIVCSWVNGCWVLLIRITTRRHESNRQSLAECKWSGVHKLM